MPLFNEDTIAAFATAPSSGAVALLRVSGPKSSQAISCLTKKETFTPRQSVLVNIYDGSQTLDKALVVFFKGPKSYSGEDLFEISLHASPYIKSRILELLAALGVRPAKAGEFTMRAFLNGKMDLAQAQGVADIIASKNKTAHKAAMYTLDGKLSQKFKNIRQELGDLLAQMEVRLDDTDEELPPLNNAEVEPLLRKIRQEVDLLAASFSTGKMVKEGIKTAIIGLPNSGKSSLLNALLGYDRAIVSPLSGTTRDTIEAQISINDFNLLLTDTAGIREHSLDPAEVEGMRRSRQAVENADLVIFVKDAALALEKAAAQTSQILLEEVSKTGKKIITVLNKADLLDEKQKTQAANGDILVSSKTGFGLDLLKDKITQTIGLGALQEDDILITSAVHYEALLKASGELQDAIRVIDELELSAEHIRAALAALKDLIGETTPEDILDIVFSKFCVGK
ncbi:MAG: tRNA uridine-5-carboxymethylaminomethyl(34) synthesis GTPase MnmE [Elusimicrobiota bacterium]|jgi:tRNA modification GTPase|nr:tRNA uridine-5-carboxymethylaminomethyl(34) synthesis GTPase MnmE [Elusimicrobiota bacterium]